MQGGWSPMRFLSLLTALISTGPCDSPRRHFHNTGWRFGALFGGA
jgi:hypothetical protein